MTKSAYQVAPVSNAKKIGDLLVKSGCKQWSKGGFRRIYLDPIDCGDCLLEVGVDTNGSESVFFNAVTAEIDVKGIETSNREVAAKALKHYIIKTLKG